MRDFRSLLSLGLLLLAAGCAEPVDDTDQAQSDTRDGETSVALDSSDAVLSLRDVPDEMVSIAEALLSGSIGTDATPAWNEESALEDTVYRYHRPDVDGVAYYEFGVSGGGRILVSTGRHDVPVPAFSDVGEPGAVHLHREALANGASVARLYHLGPLFDVATDVDEKVVSAPAGADGARSLEEQLDQALPEREHRRECSGGARPPQEPAHRARVHMLAQHLARRNALAVLRRGQRERRHALEHGWLVAL